MMENKLDFSMVEIEEGNMIPIDDKTGMPSLGNVVSPTKSKEKEELEENEPDTRIEIPDEVKEEKPLSKEPENPSSDSVFTVLIEALTEKGVISSEIDMAEVTKAINEGEEPTNILFELMSHELKSQVEYYKSQLPEKIKTLIDRYEEGVPFDELLKIKSEQQKLDNIPEVKIKEDIGLQKEIIRRYLTEKGETETRITKYIKRLEELDEVNSTNELEEDAMESLSQLTDIYKKKDDTLKEKAIEAERNREKERITFLNDLKNNINNTQEIIPNINLSEKDRKALVESMTKPVGVDERGNPISIVLQTRAINPVEFEKALHYYHHIGLFNFDKDGKFKPDFSKLSVDIKNKTVEKLSKILESNDSKGSGSVSRNITSPKAEDNVDKISKYLAKQQA